MTSRRRKQFERIEYEARSVKEMLIDMKDSTEWMLDMAYAAVVFDSSEMAREVELEENRIDTLLYHTRLSTMLSARTVEDAEQLTGILQVASAVEQMADAATDIIKLQEKDISTRPYISFLLADADERLATLRVDPDSSMAGEHIGTLGVETETGAKVIAIKRSVKWLFEITPITRIQPRDVLIVRGVQDGIEELKLYTSGQREWGSYKAVRPPRTPAKAPTPTPHDLYATSDPSRGLKGIQKIEELLMMMKDTSELMVDLSYASLLYNDKKIAREVFKLEDNMDKLLTRAERKIIKKIAPEAPEIALNMIRLSEATEKICNAAMDIADVVLRDIEPHEVLRQSILESDTLISRVIVRPGSFLCDRSLKSLRLASETGMWVVAIRKKMHWTIGPESDRIIHPGDLLFVRGPDDGLKKLKLAARGKINAF